MNLCENIAKQNMYRVKYKIKIIKSNDKKCALN